MRGCQGWSRWKMGWMALNIGCKHQRQFAIRTSLLDSQPSLQSPREYTTARCVYMA